MDDERVVKYTKSTLNINGDTSIININNTFYLFNYYIFNFIK